MSDKALLIEIFDGDKLIAKQILDQQKVIVGRILSADCRVADNRISRIHALLERLEDGSLRLTDLASSHGTFVNGERIVERILSPKDEISFAGLRTKLSYVERPAPAAAPTATSATAAVVRPAPVEAPRAPLAAAAAEPARRPPTPAPVAAPVSVPAPVSVQASPGGHVTVSSEPTVIRSLKETARTRGVLESVNLAEELEITVYWEDTILAVDHLPKARRTIRIGDAPGNDYVVPTTGLPDHFRFLDVRGQSVEIYLHASLKGSIRSQGKMRTLEEILKSGQSSVTLSGNDIAKIRVGTVNFFLMFVPEPPPLARDRIFDQGPLFWGLQATVACMAIVFAAGVALFREPIEGKVVEFPEHFRKILVEEYKKKEETKPPVVQGAVASTGQATPDAIITGKNAGTGGNEGEGMREQGEEGKRGRPDAPNKTGITNRPKVNASRKVKDAPIRASNDGILSALRNTGLGTKLAKVSGVQGGGQGNDPLDKAFAGVGGGGIRNGQGSGGSGLQGTGTGGGGTAVGVGGLGSKGFGGGAKGTGVGSLPGKGDFAVGTEAATVTVMGSLSREEIERVVNAHASEIRFCYERELARDPRLFGKVSMKWTIGEGGRVTAASPDENTTGSANIASCMADRIKRWAFPAPAAGSEASVNWNWSFKPPGT